MVRTPRSGELLFVVAGVTVAASTRFYRIAHPDHGPVWIRGEWLERVS